MAEPGRRTWRWVRIAGLAVFALAAYAFFLWRLLPYGDIARRAEQQLRTPSLAVHIEGLGPGTFPGVLARRVVVSAGTAPEWSLALEDVRLRVPMLPLLRGQVALEMEARGLGGNVHATWTAGSPRPLSVTAEDLDLSQLGVPQPYAELPLAGRLSASLEAAVDRASPEQSAGRLDATLRGVRLGAGKAIGVPVPELNLGDGRVRLSSDGGKVEVETANFENGDLGIEASGSILVRQDAARSLVNGLLSLQPTDKVAQDLAFLFAIFPGAKGSDGRYTARVRGSLTAPRLVAR